MTATAIARADMDLQATARLFIDATFRGLPGHLWVARMVGRDRATYKQVPFRYPDDLSNVLAFADFYRQTHNIYVCTTLNGSTKRRTENASVSTCLWADLDACNPQLLKVKPTILVTSSPGRHQAWWLFAEPVTADVAVSLSRRIAKSHKLAGCDTDGGLGKMMRLPGTFNHNYPDSPEFPFVVRTVA